MILYVLTLLSEITVTLLLAIRPGRKRFPMFQMLVTYTCIKDLCLFGIWVSHLRGPYFYAYYTFAIIEVAFLIGAIAEVAREMFFPVSILPGLTVMKLLSCVTGVTLACLGAGVVFPSRYPDILFSAAWTAERSSSAIACGLLWVSIGFARWLGIPMRKRLAGIVAGLTLQTSIATIALAQTPSTAVGHVIMVSGIATMIVWASAFLLPEPKLLVKNHVFELRKPMASYSLSYEKSEFYGDFERFQA